jgi:nicotinamidase-related amidase
MRCAPQFEPTGNAMQHGLLLIDIQNDYFAGGAMELVGSDDAGAQAAALLASFRRAGLPVIHVQHVSTRPGATFFLPDTRGVEIHQCVAPQPGEPVIRKHFPNGFRETSLLDLLRERQVDNLAVAGMMTHMCVDTTVRAAFDLGFGCQLAHDACATRALAFGGVTVAAADVQRAFVASLNGLFARARPAAEICAEL